MQAINSKAQRVGTSARPAADSAFLAGHVVTITVPSLTMCDGLLAIGDAWSELYEFNDNNPTSSVTLSQRARAGTRRQ